jgi:hypothetical protein
MPTSGGGHITRSGDPPGRRRNPVRAAKLGKHVPEVVFTVCDPVSDPKFPACAWPTSAEHQARCLDARQGARQARQWQEAYQDARRRAGIIREAVWIQPGPGADVAMVYLEADNLAAAFTVLGNSAEPFDRWFRDHAGQVHGIALEDGFTAPELVLDYGTNRI